MVVTTEKIASASVFLMLISLPFQSFDIGPFSVPVFFGLLNMIVFVSICGATRKITKFSYIEIFAAIYTIITLISFLFFNYQTEQPSSIIFKNIIYIAIYFSLFQLFCMIEDKQEFLIRSAKCGIMLFVVFVFYFAHRADIKLSDILSFNFYRTTFRIYQEMSQSLGGEELLTGSSTRRNAVGEAVAIYFVILLGKTNLFYTIFTFALLFGLQSRRAFFIAAAFYGFHSIQQSRYLLVQIFVGVLLLAVFAMSSSFFADDFSSRISDLSLGSRAEMYVDTIELINDRPIFGYGFGAKYHGLYVHNIILGSWYMMGLAGLIISVLIVGELIRLFFTAPHLNFLILFPLASVMVAGTAEGIFTPAGWVCVAIVRGCAVGSMVSPSPTSPPQERPDEMQHVASS